MDETHTEILIVGGGTDGVAAALGATSLGRRVTLAEETDWIGGQLTSQAVPPDEHRWIENPNQHRAGDSVDRQTLTLDLPVVKPDVVVPVVELFLN